MKRFFLFALAATALVEAATVSSRRSNSKSKSAPPEQHYYVKGEYLIMRPYEDGLEYAVVNKNLATNKPKSKVKAPNFSWSSGGRLSLGFLFPQFDHWDFSIVGTYFHNTTHDVIHASAPFDVSTYDETTSFPLPIWGPGLGVDFVGKTVSRWILNYTTVDLPLGRDWQVSPNFALHPHIGLRGAAINQCDHVRYEDNLFIGFNSEFDIGALFFETTKFAGQNHFWGIGPRIGTAFFFKFNSHWSLLGNASGSLLFGKQRVAEKLSILVFPGTTEGVMTVPPPNPLILKSHFNNTVLRCNVEGSVGVSWNTLFNHDKNKVTTTLTFEASEWFSQNHLYNTLLTGTFPSGGEGKGAGLQASNINRNGDLALVGFSLSAQFDF